MASPQVLLLDNSPRHLGKNWFGKWLRQVGAQVRVQHYRSSRWPARLDGFDALVISGSPASATEDQPWIRREIDLIEQADRRGLPVLGVCFGSQLLARAFFGKAAVRPSAQAEFGWHTVCRTGLEDRLLAGLPPEFSSFQYHTEEVVPQPGMGVLATSAAVPVQAFRVREKPVWGTQFHFEVTPQAGRDLLRRTRHFYEPYGFQYDELVAQARPTGVAPRLFQNFLSVLAGDRSG